MPWFHGWSSRTLATSSSLLTLGLDAGSPARDVNFHRLKRPVNLGAGQVNILGSGIHERLEHFIDLLQHNRDLRMNMASKLRPIEKFHKCRSTPFFITTSNMKHAIIVPANSHRMKCANLSFEWLHLYKSRDEVSL